MANIMTSTFSSTTASINQFHNSKSTAALCNVVHRRQSVTMCMMIQQEFTKSLLYLNQPRGRGHKSVLKPICAAGSGLKTSVGDKAESQIKLKKVDIVVESQDANMIKIRVDLPADETQKVFDVILSKLARSAPPTPGFRAQKGGKTSKIPKELLLNILGKDMVMKFVIREIVTSAVTDYIEKEKLAVKENKLKTTQTEDELKQLFSPGTAFGFNAELELETEENETTTSNS
ncbi:uncharacterized protein LOC141606257 [Silene latifolia]|uniref:uncharacterized protein LOC141606257 n=1 Tax=Silene latifolia TaxID=37657 RepID=UPI003D773FF7